MKVKLPNDLFHLCLSWHAPPCVYCRYHRPEDWCLPQVGVPCYKLQTGTPCIEVFSSTLFQNDSSKSATTAFGITHRRILLAIFLFNRECLDTVRRYLGAPPPYKTFDESGDDPSILETSQPAPTIKMRRCQHCGSDQIVWVSEILPVKCRSPWGTQ